MSDCQMCTHKVRTWNSQVFRIFKLARVLKLARHSPGLQVISKTVYFQKLEYIFGSWCRLLVQAIVYTLRSSYKELGLLIFLVSISGFIFARWICQIFSSGIQFRVQKAKTIRIISPPCIQPLFLHRDWRGIRLYIDPDGVLLGRGDHDHGWL